MAITVSGALQLTVEIGGRAYVLKGASTIPSPPSGGGGGGIPTIGPAHLRFEYDGSADVGLTAGTLDTFAAQVETAFGMGGGAFRAKFDEVAALARSVPQIGPLVWNTYQTAQLRITDLVVEIDIAAGAPSSSTIQNGSLTIGVAIDLRGVTNGTLFQFLTLAEVGVRLGFVVQGGSFA